MRARGNHYNCIYMYVNKVNGRKYIGQSVNFNRRHREHLNKDGLLIEKAIKKYGISNFEIIILEEDLNSVEEMNNLERYYIEKYETLVSQGGYNIQRGGNGWEVTEQFRRECSRRNVGENNYFYGKRFCGDSNPFFGKAHTEETKTRLREAWKEKYENGFKNPRLGQSLSEEQKLKISKTKREKKANGWVSPRKGCKMTEETRQKMKDNHADFRGGNHPRAKRVVQLDENGEVIREFSCVKEASEYLNISYATAKKLARGVLESCKGIRLRVDEKAS